MMAAQENGLDVHVVVKVGDRYNVVTYKDAPAQSGVKKFANNIVLAQAADANGSVKTIGCLTVALTTRLTVEQVD